MVDLSNYLCLVPALPLAAFVVLALVGGRLGRAAVSLLGVAPVGISTLLALAIGGGYLIQPPAGNQSTQTLWNWITVANPAGTHVALSVGVSFYLDPLAVVMMATITVVSFLILLYSTDHMRGDDGYSRFFAYMNLFVAAMLILVLADNMLLLYLGWEGVGLCSYLLIGFWYRDLVNVRAARKAFLVTRIGDTALAVGVFLLLAHLGTLDIQSLQVQAMHRWAPSSGIALLAAGLLLVGALGKSAQLPLHTWLPDAMVGPTPVSALIHAATMVTAGFYLTARMHALFTLAPEVQWAVAIIGAATLLLAAFAAMTQTDIKRVLAYSTMSQVGYMFLALGVGAAWAATFHFMTHAFFKSLLFLAAGTVILATGHSNDMLRMGGLRKRMPLVYFLFLAGAASLASLPLVTAGFFSKEAILQAAWEHGPGGQVLWYAGVAGALLTALYTFRMVFLVFHGKPHGEGIERGMGVEARGAGVPPARPEGVSPSVPDGSAYRPSWAAKVPMIVLAVLAVTAGYLQLPAALGGEPRFSEFVNGTFERYVPDMNMAFVSAGSEDLWPQLVASAAAILGVILAWWMVLGSASAQRLTDSATGRFWRSGWGFDRLYDALFVQPVTTLARANRRDVIDLIYRAFGAAVLLASAGLARTQNGRLRWYAAGIALGAIAVLTLVVLS